jgi:hypothetical protein
LVNQRTHTSYPYEYLRESESKKLPGLEVDEVTTDISISMGTSPTIGKILFFKAKQWVFPLYFFFFINETKKYKLITEVS